jgi:2-keto-4-pentenoate hydratase/2-oxohepta-3-ene-1,7-dioic acid hydratase in catechol pathway
MRLGRIRVSTPDGADTRLVASDDDASSPWFDLRTTARIDLLAEGASAAGARELSAALAPSSMSAALARGAVLRTLATRAVTARHPEAEVEQPAFAACVDPVRFRDFMAFEEHFSFGYRWRGLPVPDVMYELPVSYAGEPRAVLGPGDPLPWPAYTEHLDYELELGIVIGRSARDLTPETALAHVAGVTILNDVSARDIQGREMAGGLGPSKGKHFGSVVGPWFTTIDALGPSLGMRARVNGETWCDTTSDQMAWSIAELVAWASQGETLEPGSLLGTGTCNGGSGIELGRRLAPGDVVELEVDGLGILSNRVADADAGGWLPAPRVRNADSPEAGRFLT